jgi:D-alanyl-D-alanine carboxypeptidase/D-alanyl-D-alanine-endopeptidase (penicillin-binding protein 4)
VSHPAYPGGAGTSLGEKIAAILAEPVAARAHWGIAVTALDGTPIYGLDEVKLFRPASNAKLYTTAAAMALLGPASTVTTEVQSSEPTADGVVRGDVWLKSDGDANLSGMAFPYVAVAGETPASATPLKAIDDLAAQIAARGIKQITGDVVGDDTGWAWEPYPQSWAIDDMVWGYGAPVSSLSVNDSTITLTLMGSKQPGEIQVTAVQSPDVGFYTVVVHATTTPAKRPQHIEVRRAIGSRIVEVWGELPIGGKDVEQLAVSDPPLFAAIALRSRLIARGVAVDGEAVAAERDAPVPGIDGSFTQQTHEPIADLRIGTPRSTATFCCGTAPKPLTVLAHRDSPTLAQDVMYTLKESQNLHAEQMLRRLGRAYAFAASGAQGARVVRQFLINAGLDGGDFVFYDGSGLSDHDIVTPRGTAQLLAYATTQPWFAAWKAAFPIGGVDGTLASRFKDAPLKGHVYGKTGTLGESRGLSGYLDCASGKQVIFSIYVDNHTPGGSADRVAMDKIVAAIAGSN